MRRLREALIWENSKAERQFLSFGERSLDEERGRRTACRLAMLDSFL
jgi:hypothetical protein